MLLLQLKAIAPSAFGHLVITLVLAAALWFVLRKQFGDRIRLSTVLILGVFVSIYHSAGLVVNLVQARALMTAETPTAQTAAAPGALPSDPTELKSSFLRTIEAVVAEPIELPASARETLFRDYAALFPGGKTDQDEYGKAVIGAYECQRLFFEDAIASKKARKPIKSPARAECEKQTGAFFNREFLIPAEVAANNSKLIGEIIGNSTERLAQESALNAELERQSKRIAVLKSLFQL